MSVSDRKVNEFYNDKVINPKKTNDSFFSTKNMSKQEKKAEAAEKSGKQLTSTEVKLKQLYPDLSLAEIDKIKNKNIKNKFIQKQKGAGKIYPN